MQRLFQIIRYLKYFLVSTNEHGVHSPFVFDLVTGVIYPDKHYYSFPKIKLLRTKLETNQDVIHVEDFGAGSYHTKSSDRKISSILNYSGKPEKYGKLLFRLVNRFQPRSILEIGTSLGFSTAYMASACKHAKVITIEGSKSIAALAKENFTKLKLDNIKLVVGEFDDKLTDELNLLNQLDFVFFDGNHQKMATLNYFHQCLAKAHTQSVFIFDDIHWSSGMQEAWEEIKLNAKVTVTVDLFFLGIVFFHPSQAKEHFRIRY